MAESTLADVQYQIQKYWSPIFTKELRASLLLAGLCNKQYQGAIAKGGDTVRVSQVNAPSGELLTVGVNADTFSTEAISTSYVDIAADKRAVAAFEFEDLISLQSQIDNNEEVRQSLMYAMGKQMEDHLLSKVAASTSAPDHTISGVSDLNTAQLAALRVLSAQAKWLPGWYGLVDPQFYGDIIDDTTMASTDFGATDSPMIGGVLGLKRFGYTIFEDNRFNADHGLFFHPDFLHMVMQQEVQVKVSDKHALKQFGYVISVDVVFGAKLGISGDKKHIQVYNSSWDPT